MAKYRLLSVTGSVPVVVCEHPPVTSSGDLNDIRTKEKKFYNKLLLGTALMSDVGESGLPGSDPTQQFATVPSWTQKHIGIDHAFSLPPLSSSQHEVSRLNCFNSGTMALESSPVPASASMYYSKQNRFVKILYSVTSSANLVIFNSGASSPSTQEITSVRPHFVASSGNFIFPDQADSAPAEIPVFVNEYGKIVDIKIWVELITDIRGVYRGGIPSIYDSGCWTFGVSIQAPNPAMNGQFGRPLFNIPQVRNFIQSGRPHEVHPPGHLNIDNGAYPLWLGGADDGIVIAGSGSWVNFGTDMDMRTVFSDSSTTPNPYDGTGLPIDPAFGAVNFFTSSGSNPSTFLQNQYGPINSLTGSTTGSWIPWFVDPRIQGGYLSAVSATLYTTLGSGSPPPGWLTGPGGVNNVNEFPTTGSQLGPINVRPVWPLLDDVYSGLVFSTTPDNQPDYYVSTQGILGFRPGLRGSEAHGLWKLLIANLRQGVWFRQFRLELTIDQGVPNNFGTAGRSRLYKRKGIPVLSRDTVFYANVLGDTEPQAASPGVALDGLEYCYRIPGPQYGRSVGITAFTGSGDDFSVFTRLTGALAQTIGENPSFYLGNQFGTPFIPISSASLSSYSPFTVENVDDTERQAIMGIVNSKNAIPADNTLRATLSRTNYFMDMRTQVLQALTPVDNPEAPGGTYSNATRPSAISVPVGTKIYNTDTKQIQTSDGYNWKDSDGNIV